MEEQIYGFFRQKNTRSKAGIINFKFIFIDRFVKILIASVIMGTFFNYIIYFFNNELSYQENFKAIYLIGTVIAGLIFYFFIAVLIKAFKRTDINLNY